MFRTVRAARTYVLAFLAIVVAFNVWSATPTASDLDFDGVWQVWHPYMVPFLALLVLPFAVDYAPYVIRSFGGGAVASALRWLLAALVGWSLGACIYGSYLTCGNWPLWQCDQALGTVPQPSLADIGTGLVFFTCFAMGLARLSPIVGVTRAQVVSAWWLFATLLAVNAWIATPLGLARTVEAWEWTLQVAVSSYYVLANVVISGWTLLILKNARNAAGGQFVGLVAAVLVAAVVSMVNNYLFTGLTDEGSSDISISLFGVMVLSIMWAFTIAGGIVDRLYAQSSHAGAPASDEDS